MPTPQMKSFFYVLLVSLFLIISYSYLTTRQSSQSSYSEDGNPREVVVYKEKDVLKLLETLSNQQHQQKHEKYPQLMNISSESVSERADEKKSSKHDYLKKYPEFLNCRKDSLPKWATGSVVPSNMNEYTNPAPENTHNIEYLRGM